MTNTRKNEVDAKAFEVIQEIFRDNDYNMEQSKLSLAVLIGQMVDQKMDENEYGKYLKECLIYELKMLEK